MTSQAQRRKPRARTSLRMKLANAGDRMAPTRPSNPTLQGIPSYPVAAGRRPMPTLGDGTDATSDSEPTLLLQRVRPPHAEAEDTDPSIPIDVEVTIEDEDLEVEFISSVPPKAPCYETRGPSGRGPGGRGARPAGDQGGDARGLAVLEPPYTSPPLPPWLHPQGRDPARVCSSDLVLLTAPNSFAAQQFRRTRYRIEQERGTQVIAVVSPRRGEGRSVTAANLALALAEGGRVKVLLVDASLHAPAQARLFGLDEDHGLTDVLAARQDDPLAPVAVSQIGKSLFVLPAGPRAASPHAALASEPAEQLLASLRLAFRYVVLDTSAVLGSAETLAWHAMIDRYVMVARRGVTTTEDLGRAAERVDRNRILGVQLVDVDASSVGG
jgi:Mrp family chromosome partitioning ATPase